MVTPGISCGSPAANHAVRAMSPACGPMASTQPNITSSMAKAQASDAALLAARQALQCHGAIGYSFEYDLHLFMKRAWALAGSWGDAAWHRARVGRAILGPEAS